jgi:hypothetical protein
MVSAGCGRKELKWQLNDFELENEEKDSLSEAGAPTTGQRSLLPNRKRSPDRVVAANLLQILSPTELGAAEDDVRTSRRTLEQHQPYVDAYL